MASPLRRTWAEIDLSALAHNYKVLCRRMSGSGFVGVVKADAYGHGAIPVSRKLEELGAAYLAVSNVEEGRELREGGIGLPILQLGLTPANQAEALVQNRITQSLYSLDQARALSREMESRKARPEAKGDKVKVHLKIDTGMSRLGFQADEAHFDASLEEILKAAALPGLEIEGIFTHFAVSDEEGQEEREFTRLQHTRFVRMINALKAKGLPLGYVHCANSGATALHPAYAHDLFRPGILTYGLSDLAPALGLEPVMTLKTVIGCIKRYDQDCTISYGRTYRTGSPARIGVIPIGYGDGFHRLLSGQWSVQTPYGKAPIVGRICMDMCMIDLTALPQVKEGEEVIVYGPGNLVNDAAKAAQTIPYELTCAVSKRVPRIYL